MVSASNHDRIVPSVLEGLTTEFGINSRTEPLLEIEPLYAFDSVKDFIGSNDAFEVVGLNDCRVDSVSSAEERIRTHQIARRLDFLPAYRNRVREKHQKIVNGVKSFGSLLARVVDVKNFL